MQNSAYALVISTVMHISFLLALSWKFEHNPTPTPLPETTIKAIQATFINPQTYAETLAQRKKIKQKENRTNKLAAEQQLRHQRMTRERLAREKAQKRKNQQQNALALAQKKLKTEKLQLEKTAKQQQEQKEKKKKAADLRRQQELVHEQEAKQAARAKQKARAEQKARTKRIAKQKKQQQRIMDEVEKYKAFIRDKIERRWINISKQQGLSCELVVKLLPGGEVIEVKIKSGSGSPAFDQSAIVAVRRASPLPMPSDPAVFKEFREFNFIFHPKS